MPWTLENAEELAAEAPRSFFIPPAELRRALERGDEVKLIFRLERDDGEVAVERMWVEVVETEPYAGRLVNEPQLGGVIAHGATVPFGPEHVCAYAYAPGELGYEVNARCRLSRSVADADEPPALLLRRADGTWEAHAEGEDSGNELEWTLGYLTDRFPATAEALRDGSRRRGLLRRLRRKDTWWRWEDDRYRRLDRAPG